MVLGATEARPEPSILSLTALSLLVLHSWSAGARVVASFTDDRGTALGSSVLGQQGQPRLPAINDKSNSEAPHRETASLPFRRRVKCVRGLQTSPDYLCGCATLTVNMICGLSNAQEEAMLSPETVEEAMKCPCLPTNQVWLEELNGFNRK